jgi:hypothetical protein
MSIDEVGSEKTFDAGGPPNVTTKKGTRSRPATVRTHRQDSVYKQELPTYLDKLHVDGYTVLAIVPGIDIRGFEVVSYKEEKTLPNSK